MYFKAVTKGSTMNTGQCNLVFAVFSSNKIGRKASCFSIFLVASHKLIIENHRLYDNNGLVVA